MDNMLRARSLCIHVFLMKKFLVAGGWVGKGRGRGKQELGEKPSSGNSNPDIYD